MQSLVKGSLVAAPTSSLPVGGVRNRDYCYAWMPLFLFAKWWLRHQQSDPGRANVDGRP
ncbi:MAG TPA: hypothetical protein VH951_13260 [Dehalococcoidia bacterium]